MSVLCFIYCVPPTCWDLSIEITLKRQESKRQLHTDTHSGNCTRIQFFSWKCGLLALKLQKFFDVQICFNKYAPLQYKLIISVVIKLIFFLKFFNRSFLNQICAFQFQFIFSGLLYNRCDI